MYSILSNPVATWFCWRHVISVLQEFWSKYLKNSDAICFFNQNTDKNWKLPSATSNSTFLVGILKVKCDQNSGQNYSHIILNSAVIVRQIFRQLTLVWSEKQWCTKPMPCPSIIPKWFWTVLLVGYKLFWSGPNNFGQVQIRFFWPIFYILDLPIMIWTRPKRIYPVQNYLDNPKSFWTHKRTIQFFRMILIWNWHYKKVNILENLT